MPESNSGIQRELGEHDARIEATERELRELREIRKTLTEILEAVNKAKDGWGVLVMLTGIAGTIGGVVGKVVLTVVMAAPK